MSFNVFGGGSSAAKFAQNQTVDYGKISAFEQEVDVLTDTFNRLVAACHTKCIIQKYPDQELTKGESVCLDRCAMKYFSVTKKIEKILSDQRQG